MKNKILLYLIPINNQLTVHELIENCEKDLPKDQHCEIFVEVRKNE